ncbi:hypothetical protein ACLESD_08690 [Pyxidicoccus sp. 3LFB2]
MTLVEQLPKNALALLEGIGTLVVILLLFGGREVDVKFKSASEGRPCVLAWAT